MKNADDVCIKIEEMQQISKTREEERLTYDHYRVKVGEMEKDGGLARSASQADQEKYARNQTKFDTCKAKFD